MEMNKSIKMIIMPLSVAALVLLLLLMENPFRVEGKVASTYWTYVGTAFFFVLPAVPIIYGCITKEKIGAILIGVLPFLGFFIGSFIINHPGLADVMFCHRLERFFICSL